MTRDEARRIAAKHRQAAGAARPAVVLCDDFPDAIDRAIVTRSP
jgi:hypothetical protein